MQRMFYLDDNHITIFKVRKTSSTSSKLLVPALGIKPAYSIIGMTIGRMAAASVS